MIKRSFSILGILIVLLALAACHNKKVVNPIASLDSKQPDKVLFDRAMDAMKNNKFDVARLTLQTLINTYPDSEYVARAKLAVGDSWYAEGGSAAMTQAENEYRDFITFFPNMPEAAEAQLKIANIHYREMEKPDRDFTHAMRAEEEYRNLINQFPDSKLVPEAKKRLLEVQEVLAEREFRIGRFYFMRQSYNASIARLKSVVETYPLYSKADEALFILGECYQGEADNLRAVPNLKEDVKARLVKEREDMAAAAFSKIVTEYPATDRAEDAKKTLAAMHYPVPTPTPEAIARSKAIEASRSEPSFRERVMANLHRGPDVSTAAKNCPGCEPTLVDPKQTSAVEEVRQFNSEMAQIAAEKAKEASGGNSLGGGNNNVSVEAIGTGTPPPNEAPPRSDAGSAPPAANDPNAVPELTPIPDSTPAPATQAAPPTQVNEVEKQGDASAAGSSSSPSTSTPPDQASSSTTTGAASTSQSKSDDYSTSKHKKKKGLHKLIPF